ncbi:MAG: hypothetical protein WCK35_17980 [Chloroflexota bacterium]
MANLDKKHIIKFVIEVHQRVINTGGITTQSWLYQLFVRRQHLVLKLFNLPPTNENLLTTVNYPCSFPADSLLGAAFCRFPNGFVLQSRAEERSEIIRSMATVGTERLIVLQIEYVYNNLTKLAKHYKKS